MVYQLWWSEQGKPSVVRKQARPNKSKALLFVVPTILPVNQQNFHFSKLSPTPIFTFPTFTFPNFLTKIQLSLQIGEWVSHAAAHPWSQLSLSDFLHRHLLILSDFCQVSTLSDFCQVSALSDFCQILTLSDCISFPAFPFSVSVSSNWHFFKQSNINGWLVTYTFQIIHWYFLLFHFLKLFVINQRVVFPVIA